MARIRTIKPDAFRSETLSELSLQAERTFFGLLTEVDDDGRLKERAAVLNGALWSSRPEHTVRDMERDLDDLAATDDLLCRYSVDGVKFFHLPTFKSHQVINRPTKSKLPACPTCPVRRGGGVPDEVFDGLIAEAEATAAEKATEEALFEASEPKATVHPLPRPAGGRG